MGGQRGRRSQNGSNSPIGAEQWGVKGVRRVDVGQILQLMLNNGGVKGVQRGRRGRNGSNSPIGAEQWACQGGRSGRNGSNSPIVAEQWGVKEVGGVEMDQILQLVLNKGGSRGPRGRNGSNSPIGAEQWGVKGVRGPALRGSEKSRK